MVEKLKNLNEFLFDLMIGIAIFAVLCELVGVWFAGDKMYYSMGILIGLILAEFSAWYMAFMLYKAMHMNEKGATNHVRLHTLIRYGILVIVILSLVYTDFANPLAAFLVLMGIKASAYAVPLIHRVLNKD
jgi:Co/Zn/Cd efflux system component